MSNCFYSKNKAFTLIELLVVISIISVFASIVFASISSAREKARIVAGKQFAASTYHALGDQLVGAWNFDECAGTTVSDSSGSGNNGTFVGTPLWSHTTPSGTGCSLDANNNPANYVTVTNSPSLQLSSDFTVSMWVYIRTNAADSILIQKGDNTVHGLMIGYGFLSGGFSIQAVNAINGPVAAVGDDLNKWHQLTAVVETSTGKKNLYVDGKIVASRVALGDTQYSWGNNNDLSIGNGIGSAYGSYGLIDEVKVYAKNFSAMDVRNRYLAERESFMKLALAK